MDAPSWIAALLGAYLLGAVPFGFLIVRLASGRDVRQSGSGNIGATNVLRTAGPGLGILTLALDAAKGAAAVLLARAFLPPEGAGPWMAGLAAVLGHIFPLFLRFRGGKGVATCLGVLLVLSPLAVLPCLTLFVLVVLLGRLVSAGSIAAALALPPAAWWLDGVSGVPLAAAAACSAAVVWSHRQNIARILRGEEHRLGDRRNGRRRGT